MRRYPRIAALMVALLLPVTGWAQGKPPELASILRAQTPVGTTQMRKLFLHVYDASFWSDQGDTKKAPYALSITYAMGFTGRELATRTREEMAHVSDQPDASLRRYENQLAALFPDVAAGDRITALALADGSTAFYCNSKKIGVITDPNFTTAFFAIWLSPKSSEPTMRQQLLNQPGE